VIITGSAGSGRSTATGALEDLGFEAIDNLPQSLLPHLFAGPPIARPVVVGIDTRNREFDVARLQSCLEELVTPGGRAPVLVYLDCDPTILMRRYSETRRRHPLSPHETPLVGITREIEILAPLRERADVLIDTTAMTPHDLRAEMGRLFGGEGTRGGLVVSLHSFSYKGGTPRGVDMIIDVRFLKNPHWDPALRPLDGRDQAVQAFVAADPAFAPFHVRLLDLLRFLLPAYQAEGKSYFGVGLGCTGGRHRSVMLVETLAKTLAADGWQVSIRHRDLARAEAAAAPGVKVGS
jgi:UPF0042 nucleotide-binding protein